MHNSALNVGLLVNPIAGVGASLAWKGTDDVDAAWNAVKNGYPQPIWKIVDRALASIPSNVKIKWLFGDKYDLKISGQVVYESSGESRSQDTRNAIKLFVGEAVDLILFAGGDGTAVDVGTQSAQVPILGIPGGVKIFSPCFLHRPEDLGSFLENWDGSTVDTDILDLDEELYKTGLTQAKLVGSAKIPVSQLIQSGKKGTSVLDSDTLAQIAERITDDGMLNKSILVGAGSTMQGIFRNLNIEISLLGIDLVVNGKLEQQDCTSQQIEDAEIDEIWITPIGIQGHIFGRGNRQISASKIQSVGKKGILIFSTLEKIRNTPILYVDTGDPQVDSMLRGYIKVIVGYHDEIVRKIL